MWHQELFSAIDQDNSGFINIKEMIEFLQSVCDDEVDESEVRGIFTKMDVTGDRTIDFWEFEVSIFLIYAKNYVIRCMQKEVMEKVKNAGWRRVQRRRNRNGSICTRVSDLRFDLETRPDGARVIV